jgi:MYXO-CTERM domain-containing protein
MRATTSIRLPLALLAGLLLAGLLFSTPLMAQSDEPMIVSDSVESNFPDGLVFGAVAQGPDRIEHLRVLLRLPGNDTLTNGRLDITPGTEVSGEYLLRTRTSGQYVPPGTPISYVYELRDSAGRVVRTPEKEVIYEDSRFQWLQLSKGLVTVYYYGGSLAEFVKKRAEIVLDAAVETVENMAPVLGIDPNVPIRVVSYNNYRDMSGALPFRSQAVREDLITQGMAWPDERVVLVLGDDTTITGITSHELTHILVAEAAGRGYSRLPVWLNEGLAEYGNVDQGESYTQALIHGIYTRRVKPLWYLSDFGGDPEDIVIAYGHSRSVVRYMISRYGPEKIAELMRTLRTTLDIDDALEQVYGVDQHGLDTDWRLQIGLDPLPKPDELEELRKVESEESSDATPAPVPATSAPQPAPEAAASEQEPLGRTSTSCSSPSADAQASIPLGMLAFGLLAGPLLFRRRKRGD